MAKPTEETRWASETGANISLPDSTRFNLGWQFEETPASSWQNYMMNSHGKWIEYLDVEVDALKTPGVVEIFYLKVISGDSVAAGGIYECSTITDLNSGLVLLRLPAIDLGTLPEGESYLLIPVTSLGVATAVWPASLSVGVVSITTYTGTPGTSDTAVRKYLSFRESTTYGGIYVVYDADWSAYVQSAGSFHPVVTSGSYQQI